jgi:hypothetical protein
MSKKRYLSDFPDLLKEWHPTKNKYLSPDKISYRSSKKVWWKCSKGSDHEWLAFIYSRTTGRGCPFCAGKKVSVTNSLATLFPQIAKEWHPTKNFNLTPDDIVAGTSKIFWWICSKGSDHEWRTSPYHRINGTSCPFCAGKKISVTNSLVTVSPLIAKEWHHKKK